MRFYEAMKLLEEGKNVRVKSWNEDCFIYMNDDGFILDEKNEDFEVCSVRGEWEEYIEEGKIEELKFGDKDYIEDKIRIIIDKQNEVIREFNKIQNIDK